MATVPKTATVRVDPRTLKKLDDYARAKNRSRAAVVKEALDQLIEYDKWFVGEVEAGLRDIDGGDVLEHEEVVKIWERKREAALERRRSARPRTHRAVHQ